MNVQYRRPHPAGGPPSGLSNYQEVAVSTASPQKLLLMLYDGALRFCVQAREATLRGDIAERRRAIGRVMAIVEELLGSLHSPVAKDLCTRLESLYLHVLGRLAAASASPDDGASLDEVSAVLSKLREGWQHVLVAAPPGTEAAPAGQGEGAQR